MILLSLSKNCFPAWSMNQNLRQKKNPWGLWHATWWSTAGKNTCWFPVFVLFILLKGINSLISVSLSYCSMLSNLNYDLTMYWPFMLKVQVLSYSGHTKIVLLFFPYSVPFLILKLHADIITMLSVLRTVFKVMLNSLLCSIAIDILMRNRLLLLLCQWCHSS